MPPFRNKKMQPVCTKRLMVELDEIMTNPPPLVSAGLRGDNLLQWEATIVGPPNSPYEEGVFKLHLDFPLDYPIRPPTVMFKTRIYHCNIGTGGTICLDILRNKWSPAFRVSTLLVSICSLLTDCNPEHGLQPAIARLYKKNKTLHDQNARKYTEMYAAPRRQK